MYREEKYLHLNGLELLAEVCLCSCCIVPQFEGRPGFLFNLDSFYLNN